MKSNELLQVIFAFFLGLVVVAFVGIGVNTLYPEPPAEWTETGPSLAYGQWQLMTGIILLICATVILVVSLLLPEDQAVVSNGVLMGGVFTMIYAVGVTMSSPQNIMRLVVAAIALAVTVGVGYLKFVRGRKRAKVAAGQPVGLDNEMVERLTAVEQRLEAVRRALHE